MKLPVPDLRAVPDLLLRHGEKAGLAVAALVGLLLAWGGIDALRSESVTDDKTPEAVDRAATQARNHIDREAQPPADLLPAREPLADAIDPWRVSLVPWQPGAAPGLTIATPPASAVLDNPLFAEVAKRGKPDVLPVEDLRAVAGLAVVPVPVPADGPARQAPPPVEKPRRPERRPQRGVDPLAAPPNPAIDAAAAADAAASGGRIVPYVVVTGLIPVAKQQDEYRRRFEAAARPADAEFKGDRPLWSDYEIDRGVVGRDGKETWTRIDLAAIAALRSADWAAVVPEKYQLAKDEDVRSRSTTPIGFCCALPPRIDGGWELADLHPWVADRLATELAQQRREQERQQPEARGPVEAEGAGGVDETEPRPPELPVPEAGVELPEYRMFRFVDVTVEPGSTYRYRVRLKVRNPNYDKNPERMRPYLEDPALAVETKLTSPDSAASSAVTVPDATRVLVEPLRAAESKELKIKPGSGTLEVLVLGPSDRTGSFALRALVADPGAVVNVDEKLNAKGQRDRARGERIDTGRLLLDAVGRQDDPRDGPVDKSRQPTGVPEPLDVICLRPDGSFERASFADSERWVTAYGSTLPPRGTKADAREPAPGGIRGEPPFDPLANPAPIPGAGR